MITIVTGSPRGGTSMTMNILDEGGVKAIHNPLMHKNINPHGSFEISIDKVDFSTANGKCIKILGAEQIFNLPVGEYKVILPVRDAEQILLSRVEVFKTKQLPTNYDKQIKRINQHRDFLRFVINSRTDMELIEIPFEDYYLKPEATVKKIADFVDEEFDESKARECILTDSYKVRTKEEVEAKLNKKSTPVDNVLEDNVL
jgi:hypothetical protein